MAFLVADKRLRKCNNEQWVASCCVVPLFSVRDLRDVVVFKINI